MMVWLRYGLILLGGSVFVALRPEAHAYMY